MAQGNPIKRDFQQQLLGELLPSTSQSIISLREDDSVEKAVRVLSENRILSAPVITKSGECAGFVDMLDIVWFVVSVAPEPEMLTEAQLKSQHLEMAGRAMSLALVSEIMACSGRDPCLFLSNESNVSMLVDLFSKGVHRAAVVDSEEKIQSIVSQSQIVKLMAERCHMGSWKRLGDMSVEELGLTNSSVVTVASNNTVLEVLTKIKQHNVSGVAVVDSTTGKIVGNFSGSDLRGMYQERWPSFLKPVLSYLKEHSPGSTNVIACKNNDTLLHVCQTLFNNHIHRLWIVDDDGKPTGLISTTDICRFVCTYEGGL